MSHILRVAVRELEGVWPADGYSYMERYLGSEEWCAGPLPTPYHLFSRAEFEQEARRQGLTPQPYDPAGRKVGDVDGRQSIDDCSPAEWDAAARAASGNKG